jgi:phage terminase small subunit
MALKEKQKRFCLEYVKDLNATQACIRVGYSKNTARQQGARLLSNANIKSEIARLVGKATARSEIDLAWLLSELKTISSANMADFMTWERGHVYLTPSAELPRELLAAVESVGETQDKAGRVLVKIKLLSKLQAINTILRLYEITEVEARVAALEQRMERT